LKEEDIDVMGKKDKIYTYAANSNTFYMFFEGYSYFLNYAVNVDESTGKVDLTKPLEGRWMKLKNDYNDLAATLRVVRVLPGEYAKDFVEKFNQFLMKCILEEKESMDDFQRTYSQKQDLLKMQKKTSNSSDFVMQKKTSNYIGKNTVVHCESLKDDIEVPDSTVVSKVSTIDEIYDNKFSSDVFEQGNADFFQYTYEVFPEDDLIKLKFNGKSPVDRFLPAHWRNNDRRI
jgi:hypothetical protein